MILHLNKNVKHFSFRCRHAGGTRLRDFAKQVHRGITGC